MELKAKVAASQSPSLATQLITMDKALVTQMAQSGAQIKEIRAAVVGKTNRPLKREERQFIDDAIESFAEQRAAAEEERRCSPYWRHQR